jgi:hypothetical protein
MVGVHAHGNTVAGSLWRRFLMSTGEKMLGLLIRATTTRQCELALT